MRSSRSAAFVVGLVVALAALVAVAPPGVAAERSAASPDAVPQAADPPTITSISAGAGVTCGVATDQQVECAGRATTGNLGGGLSGTYTHSRTKALLTSSTVLQGKTIRQVATSEVALNACAVTTDGILACWGGGPLRGDGTAPGLNVEPSPVVTAGTPLAGKVITEVSLGSDHACALTSEGKVACWGNRTVGQLGDGTVGTTTQAALVPVGLVTAGTVLAGKTIARVSAGERYTCVVTTDGIAACWGSNAAGRLGNPAVTSYTTTAVAVDTAGTVLAGKPIASIAASGTGDHTCAVTTDGIAACWGRNDHGQLGNGVLGNPEVGATNRKAHAVVTAGTPLAGTSFASIDVGRDHTCGVTTGGLLACWGLGRFGSLGDGDLSSAFRSVSLPQMVTRTGTPLAQGAIVQVSIGDSHTCAVSSSGVAGCWGLNDFGELGDGTTTDSGIPTGILPRALVPSAPTGVTVGAGNGRATIRWTAPASVGGSAITRYVVAVYEAGQEPRSITTWVTSPGATGTSGVISLANGRTYRVRVAAENTTGSRRGTWSAMSAPFMPKNAATPFPSSTALVDRLFRDIVARPPTTAERTTWVGSIDTGARTKGELADFLRRSSENTTNADPTTRLYRAVLGRSPDHGGLVYWVGRLRSGQWSLTRMANFFASSAEFRTKYGQLNNRQFVQQVYVNILGRPGEPSGVDFWTSELDSGRRTRGKVVVGFSESAEYKGTQRENTDVALAYTFLLLRAPTTSEASAWVTAQRGGTSHAALLTALIDSPGYAAHIGA